MNIRLPEKFLPRLIMTVFGVIICAIAVGFFKNSLFGIDPFQSFAQGSHARLFSGVSFRQALYWNCNHIELVLLGSHSGFCQ